jgi:hypothetical protein
MVVISAVVLGLSVLATLAKFLDWFLHSDPRTMVRTARWMALLLLVVLVALVVYCLAERRWSTAMLLSAVAIAIPLFLNWRALLTPLRTALSALRARPRPLDMEMWPEAPDDPRAVRRAAAILEAYVNRASLMALSDRRGRPASDAASSMTRGEALEVLGLEPGTAPAEVREAHRRLRRVVHPDRGGSAGLLRRVDEAAGVLLDAEIEQRDGER